MDEVEVEVEVEVNTPELVSVCLAGWLSFRVTLAFTARQSRGGKGKVQTGTGLRLIDARRSVAHRTHPRPHTFSAWGLNLL